MPRFIVVVLMLVGAYTVAGCGNGSTPSKSPEAPSGFVSSQKLPPEYRTLAQILSLEIKSSPDQFRDNKSITEVTADGHGALMAFRAIQSSDQEINYIAEQGQSTISEAVTRMEKINTLPKPPGAGELCFSSFIDGLFGNIYGGYARGLEAENKQNALLVEFQALVAACEKADALHQLLPKVAEKYSAPLTSNGGRIEVDFEESWGWWGPNDWLSIYNSGPALQDCTVVTQLTGEQRQIRKNVHFIKYWPEKTWMYARYEPGFVFSGRNVGRMTVSGVQDLDVTVFSPQFATSVHHVYQGLEKDKKIAARCKEIKLLGRYRPFKTGVVWNTERGALLTLDGVPFLGKCGIDVVFRREAQSKGWYWEIDNWKKGEEKTFGTSEGQLTFDPEFIDIVIYFPGTNYKYEGTIPVGQ